jgi:hypothetical protein
MDKTPQALLIIPSGLEFSEHQVVQIRLTEAMQRRVQLYEATAARSLAARRRKQLQTRKLGEPNPGKMPP